MGFLDSYKRLERYCGDLYGDDLRLGGYIEEMENTPHGPLRVSNWDKDLSMLKRCRWLRNQIVHDPDCTESNMVEPEDNAWLTDFYSRLLNQADPLALYEKAVKRPAKSKQARSHPAEQPIPTAKNSDKDNSVLILFAVICIVLLIFTLFQIIIQL